MKKKFPIAITQFPTPIKENAFILSNEEKKKRISKSIYDILDTLGLDLTHPSLQETPRRVADMYVDEIFSGLNPKAFPKISLHPHGGSLKEIVFVKNIFFISFCEHHLVPMIGEARIGYFPQGNVLGLSKMNRIVRYFARRPQLQERLTAQIVDSLAMILKTEDVAVSISAKHYCVMARGVEDTHSHTETFALRGLFESDISYRQAFFSLAAPNTQEKNDSSQQTCM